MNSETLAPEAELKIKTDELELSYQDARGQRQRAEDLFWSADGAGDDDDFDDRPSR